MPSSPSASTARVTIRRTDAQDVQHRQIYARIDDTPNRMLLFGDSTTIEVAAGRHKLKANNTLYWKSVSFDVQPGEHVEFMVINKASRLTFGFLALLGAAPLALAIERRP
jgi:hypothetical protein